MKKILFSDKFSLTQAVLDGRKTQTRRIVPKSIFQSQHDIDDDKSKIWIEDMYGDWHDVRKSKYCFKVGEVVAVAQSYKDAGFDPNTQMEQKIRGSKTGGIMHLPIRYVGGWNNKIFVSPALMPHRIRITDVRVEHLQAISDDACIAEGVELNPRQYEYDGQKVYFVRNLGHWRSLGCDNFKTPREAYAALIDKIAGKGVWDSNPYVFVYEFELVK